MQKLCKSFSHWRWEDKAVDHHAELEGFGTKNKFRRRQKRKPMAFLALPRRLKYRCMACGDEFRELDFHFRSIESHERQHEVAPWDPEFDINPMPEHNFNDVLRTV
jgi:hypothetical protein